MKYNGQVKPLNGNKPQNSLITGKQSQRTSFCWLQLRHKSILMAGHS